jgi:hypothetical protein
MIFGKITPRKLIINGSKTITMNIIANKTTTTISQALHELLGRTSSRFMLGWFVSLFGTTKPLSTYIFSYLMDIHEAKSHHA